MIKDSIIKSIEDSLKNMTSSEAIKYYQYILDNNKESSVLPIGLIMFYKDVIIGIKANKELINNESINKGY